MRDLQKVCEAAYAHEDETGETLDELSVVHRVALKRRKHQNGGICPRRCSRQQRASRRVQEGAVGDNQERAADSQECGSDTQECAADSQECMAPVAAAPVCNPARPTRSVMAVLAVFLVALLVCVRSRATWAL
jgi:hypothetical protein